jgi:hypothetical protein
VVAYIKDKYSLSRRDFNPFCRLNIGISTLFIFKIKQVAFNGISIITCSDIIVRQASG